MNDILSQIVEQRRADINSLGLAMGFELPEKRNRRVHPFVNKKSVILEVKRASPSKGDIAPGLDSAATAVEYQKAGARAISVLTEGHWFKGGLSDLVKVTAAVNVAVLRKDFLLFPDEVDISYRCGADAVLLIARVLDTDTLRAMLARCGKYGITAFVELRLEEDLTKLKMALDESGARKIVCGVNARDLKNFSIDLLKPSAMLEKIKKTVGKKVRVVFESGIRTPEAAAFAGGLGFDGLLLGESAAKNPGAANHLVRAFLHGHNTKNTEAWLSMVSSMRKKPLVKVCGLTNKEDALLTMEMGADFLGFIFSKKSKRFISPESFLKIREAVKSAWKNNKPRFVAVITECSSEEGRAALYLAKKGLVDFVQLHGEKAVKEFYNDKKNLVLPHYAAVNLVCDDDLQKLDSLLALGEPRILIDAGKAGEGGTGKRVDSDLIQSVKKRTPLWLAGGLCGNNVREVISDFEPELIDASSLLESSVGQKNMEKLKTFFREMK